MLSGPGILGMMQQNQQQQQPQGGMLLGGPQAPTGPQAPQQPGGLIPNMNAGQAGAIAGGLNLASQSMPHPAQQGPQQGSGLTAQGVMQAMHGGMGGGMNMAG